MQEETNSIVYQRTQNGWSKMSIYILQLLPKHMKQITKCHALQVYVVVENVENLDVEWCVCACVCVRACVRVCVPRCSALSLPGLFGRFGLVCIIHKRLRSWETTDTLS
jgi:hypothetical protein